MMLKKPRYGRKQRKECKGGCRDGVTRFHDSVEEARYCNQLLILQKAGEFDWYESQKTFPLRDPDGNSAGAHRVDFVIWRGEEREVHEYKGKLFGTLPEYRTKKALFKWCYPEIPYTTVSKRDVVL